MTELWQRSAEWIADAVRSGELRAVEVATACLDRIEVHDRELGAFLGIDRERVLADAAAIDTARERGDDLGPLAGVPVAWKDNLVRRGSIATAGSRLLEPFESPYSATVIERLERAGAVLLGRTNLDEFGMGSTTENSGFGPTHNPWNHKLVPGGSSGGSAAAVAADFCPLAIGSDTGGSVRQPAAFCGISGLKPSYGRVSRSGLIAYASSLDCVGALSRNAADLALWLRAVEGIDPRDPTSAKPGDCPTRPAAAGNLQGVTIGVPWQLNGPGVDEDVARAITAATEGLQALGAATVECSLPSVEHAVATYYLVATAEASSNLARYDGVRFGSRRDGQQRLDSMMTATRTAGFGNEVQLRVLLGTFALRAGYYDEFYGQAGRVRELMRREFARAFEQCDVLVSPTSPVAPFELGSRIEDPLAMYLCDALTVPASLAGVPALSIPCGMTGDDRPIGLQLMAADGHDGLLLQVAEAYQANSEHHLMRAMA